jgi:hypothetical protein
MTKRNHNNKPQQVNKVEQVKKPVEEKTVEAAPPQQKTNIQQILENPNPQNIIIFQQQKINQLHDELIVIKTNLEDMSQYAIALENRILQLQATGEKAE